MEKMKALKTGFYIYLLFTFGFLAIEATSPYLGVPVLFLMAVAFVKNWNIWPVYLGGKVKVIDCFALSIGIFYTITMLPLSNEFSIMAPFVFKAIVAFLASAPVFAIPYGFLEEKEKISQNLSAI